MSILPDQADQPDEPDRPAGVLTCSARGCRRAATTGLRWNNPTLHPPERRKTWLACPDHEDSLGQYLAARNFLRESVPVDRLDSADLS